MTNELSLTVYIGGRSRRSRSHASAHCDEEGRVKNRCHMAGNSRGNRVFAPEQKGERKERAVLFPSKKPIWYLLSFEPWKKRRS
jgi:hypothetical protein